MKGFYKHTNRKQKVLFCFVQTEHQSNGGVISLINIAQSLVNFTPIFLSQARTKRTDALVASGFTVVHINAFNWRSRFLKPFSVLFWNIRIIRTIRRYDISVVHANDNQMAWRTIFATKLFGRKFVSNIRGVFEPNVRYGWSRLWVNLCDDIIVLSDEMRSELAIRLPFINRTKAEERLRVIRSIIDPGFFREKYFIETRSEQFTGSILIVAAFNPLKNQLAFLRETALWFKERGICIHFFGDYDPVVNTYARECQSVVEELNVSSHICFHGFTGDIQDAYRMADVTLVVSRREGLARCMIESLACGTPVVSFDVCSAREILVGNDCGVVVRQGNYMQLCIETEVLLVDLVKRKRLSCNGISAAKNLFNKEAIIRQYEQVYKEL